MHPDDFTQPLLHKLRHDILLAIQENGLDCGSTLCVLADVIGHAIGAGKTRQSVEEAVRKVNHLVRVNSKEIFENKSSLLVMESV